MRKDSLVRFSAIALALLTATTVVFAVINWQKESQYTTPTDGVWWREQSGLLLAKGVIPSGPGEKAGIKVGDRLLRVNGLPKDQTIKNIVEFEKHLYRSGVYSRATYLLDRQGVNVEVGPVIPVPADNSLKLGQRLIALIYLGIGLYVLFRRWTAPKSTHFYAFCLVSFVLYSFHYTGKLNAFDQAIYWSSIVAWLLQPALFLHFALTFPKPRRLLAHHPWAISLAYLPGAVLLAMQLAAVSLFEFTESLRWDLDRLQMVYQTMYFAAAAVILWRTYRQASTPLQQQQLKWISRGTVLAIGPYTLFYVVPYIAGALPTPAMKISVLSLVFLPVTWGYAIVRYRLMDVDIIFKRGVAYTLATAAIVVAYFVGIGSLAGSITTKYPGTGTFGLIAVIIITALIFEPLKNWIQVRVDRFFYRKRYDYRRTLIEFGRELSSETDLHAMLTSVIDRLSRTLLVDRIAIFLATDANAHDFVMEKSFGISYAGSLDLSFLVVERPEQYAGHIFFDNTRKALQESV
ncbi:MAG TPA: PDZ domain-containing protein, partial [Candidatus Angelobacter sp.]|nr:PDZ domain-containing protein [Candidatus Angelobacter sp.]